MARYVRPAPVVSTSLVLLPLAAFLRFLFSCLVRSRAAFFPARSSRWAMVRATWTRPRTVIAERRVSALP